MILDFGSANFPEMRRDASKVQWFELLDADTVGKLWRNFIN